MESERLTIERAELYCQVWAEPIFRLAPNYGISNVALKKICKKLNVPTPPRGYWAKIQNHIRVERTPLPKIKYDQPKVHELNMNRSPAHRFRKEGYRAIWPPPRHNEMGLRTYRVVVPSN